MEMTSGQRGLLVAAGIAGALGVATAAYASHVGGGNLAIAANFLLFHAAALIGLSLIARRRLALTAGIVLAVGLVLFAGDLAMRGIAGTALFPFAAPLGGGCLMLGWVLVAVAGLFAGRERQ